MSNPFTAPLRAEEVQVEERSLGGEQGTADRIATLEAENAALKSRLEEALEAPIRTLLEAERLTEARQLVALLLKAAPSPRLERWARVIAPPVVHVGGQVMKDFGVRQWLREHAHEFTGQWVALREGVVLGANESRVVLHRKLQESGTLEGALFVCL